MYLKVHFRPVSVSEKRKFYSPVNLTAEYVKCLKDFYSNPAAWEFDKEIEGDTMPETEYG